MTGMKYDWDEKSHEGFANLRVSSKYCLDL